MRYTWDMDRARTHTDNAARQRAYRQRKRAGQPLKVTQREAAALMSVSVRSVQRMARIQRWKAICEVEAPDIANEIAAMLQAVEAGSGMSIRTIERRCEALIAMRIAPPAKGGDSMSPRVRFVSGSACCTVCGGTVDGEGQLRPHPAGRDDYWLWCDGCLAAEQAKMPKIDPATYATCRECGAAS